MFHGTFKKLSALIPHADFPEALLSRRERFSLVINRQCFARSYLAAIPQIAGTAAEHSPIASDQYLIRNLLLAALI
jgi:hypothetical protein